MVDLAQHSLFNQVLGIAGSCLEAIGEAHHVRYALFRGGLGQDVGFLSVHGHGLFHRKRLSGLDRSHGDFKVHIVGGGDIHRIHIRAVDQVVIIGKAVGLINAIFLLCIFQGLGIGQPHSLPGPVLLHCIHECGHLFDRHQTRDGQINPVDSEHSAIWQSLRAGTHSEVSRLIVTASGGPFRGWTREQMRDITPEQALNHPTWHMGPVVTINSSTLMNKGLEVIEASRLFNIEPDRIEVTVHPQSVVHSMVEFCDGATISQASPPDMRLPIALGLSAPERLSDVAQGCDWTQAAEWTFEPLDDEAFPAVELARHCLRSSEKHTAVLNAANEQAVHAFLNHHLPYLAIVDTVSEVLDEMDGELRGDPQFASVADMVELEQEARVRADTLIAQR